MFFSPTKLTIVVLDTVFRCIFVKDSIIYMVHVVIVVVLGRREV